MNWDPPAKDPLLAPRLQRPCFKHWRVLEFIFWRDTGSPFIDPPHPSHFTASCPVPAPSQAGGGGALRWLCSTLAPRKAGSTSFAPFRSPRAAGGEDPLERTGLIPSGPGPHLSHTETEGRFLPQVRWLLSKEFSCLGLLLQRSASPSTQLVFFWTRWGC